MDENKVDHYKIKKNVDRVIKIKHIRINDVLFVCKISTQKNHDLKSWFDKLAINLHPILYKK